MKKRFHIGFYTQDLDRSVQFYRELFGQEPTRIFEDYAQFVTQNPPLNFTLNLTSEPFENPISHYGIQHHSTESLAAEKTRHQDNIILEEVEESCCYANQDKFWLEDPLGIRVEQFFTHETFTNPERNAKRTCCEETCCP